MNCSSSGRLSNSLERFVRCIVDGGAALKSIALGRHGRKAALSIFVSFGATVAHSQGAPESYPNRPVRITVPWATGGGADTLSRFLAPHLSKRIGQPVVIDNRPGAGGNIGAELSAKAAPDGYTVLFAGAATHSINPGLYPDLRFKASDFAPVGLLVRITNILVVNQALPVYSVRDLMDYARSHPVNYASAGNGSIQHLAAEMFKAMGGVSLTHVPYKGGGPAVAATVGGETQVLFADPLPAMPFIKSGRLRAIAVTGAQRLESLPGIPTVAETGMSGYEADSWSGVLVPAGTPKAIVSYLNREINAVLNMPEVKARLSEQGLAIAPTTPEEFGAFIESETARWGKVISAAKVKVD